MENSEDRPLSDAERMLEFISEETGLKVQELNEGDLGRVLLPTARANHGISYVALDKNIERLGVIKLYRNRPDGKAPLVGARNEAEIMKYLNDREFQGIPSHLWSGSYSIKGEEKLVLLMTAIEGYEPLQGMTASLIRETEVKSGESELISLIFRHMQNMFDQGVVHGDVHLGNVGFMVDDDSKVIGPAILDFENARRMGSDPLQNVLWMAKDLKDLTMHLVASVSYDKNGGEEVGRSLAKLIGVTVNEVITNEEVKELVTGYIETLQWTHRGGRVFI